MSRVDTVHNVGPLIFESFWAVKQVSTGALGAVDDQLVVQRKFERAVEFLQIIPKISSDFGSDLIYEFRISVIQY